MGILDVPEYIPRYEKVMKAMEDGLIPEDEILKDLSDWDTKVDGSWNQRSKTTGRGILHEAAVHGHKEIVKFMLEKTECDVNLKSLIGRLSALHLAAGNIVYLLLTHGADAKSRDRFGNTPLHEATTRNCARLIVEYEGKVSLCNRSLKDARFVAKERDPENKELLSYLEDISLQEYRAEQAEIKRRKMSRKQVLKKKLFSY